MNNFLLRREVYRNGLLLVPEADYLIVKGLPTFTYMLRKADVVIVKTYVLGLLWSMRYVSLRENLIPETRLLLK